MCFADLLRPKDRLTWGAERASFAGRVGFFAPERGDVGQQGLDPQVHSAPDVMPAGPRLHLLRSTGGKDWSASVDFSLTWLHRIALLRGGNQRILTVNASFMALRSAPTGNDFANRRMALERAAAATGAPLCVAHARLAHGGPARRAASASGRPFSTAIDPPVRQSSQSGEIADRHWAKRRLKSCPSNSHPIRARAGFEHS